MGYFPVLSHSGNHYIMPEFHVNTNTILVEPFKSKHDQHRLTAYNCIITRIKKCGHTVDIKILDNESIQTYRSSTEDNWY